MGPFSNHMPSRLSTAISPNRTSRVIDSSRSRTQPGAKNYVAAALTEAMAGHPVTVPASRPYGCAVKYPGATQ